MEKNMEERRAIILNLLDAEGKVSVNELSEVLECSQVTIRSDIRELEKENRLIRTHGGALKKEESFLHYHSKSLYRRVSAKRQIAACAYRFIEDQDTIILDDASTSFYLALEIKAHPEKHLAIVTNSIISANELSECPYVELYMVGGIVGGYVTATLGEAAAESIRQFQVDKAFMGVHGINFKCGLTSIGTPQKQIKQAILDTTNKVYVLADSSKFNNGYLTVICPFNRITKIITDKDISQENIRSAELAGVPLVLA